ncbi:MAG: hypothetical protein WC675_03125 [Patescibacteria group bacterium]
MEKQECIQPQVREQPTDFDFDISRTFTVLTATLVLPVYLALSVVSYSMAAIY